MTSLHGKNIISKGWEKTGIDDESKWELLKCNHRIRLMKPIVRGRKEILDNDLMTVLTINKDRLVEGCTTVEGEDGDGSKQEDPNDDGCAFDLFNDYE